MSGVVDRPRHQAILDDVAAGATGVLVVDLDAVARNYAALDGVVGAVECAAAVKANAYGLGAREVVARLGAAGCGTFFVATIDEGLEVRARDATARVYVLDGLLPGAARECHALDLRPVLNSLAEIEEWSAYCRAEGEALAAGVHVDTGMNRLGLDRGEAERLCDEPARLDGFLCALLVSHLACGDEPGDAMNEAQRAAFTEIAGRLPAMPSSLANSAGVMLGDRFHFDLVRPGIALYGGRAVNGVTNPMRPVVTVYARILQIREAGRGETVGYGATQHLAAPRRLATIACGYADGFARHLSGSDDRPGVEARIAGHPVRVAGRVSMDLITLDVTDVAGEFAHRGGWVELIGEAVTVDDLADHAGTIGYEILTRFGKRFQRAYVKA